LMDGSEVHDLFGLKRLRYVRAGPLPGHKKTVFHSGQCWGVIANGAPSKFRGVAAARFGLPSGFLGTSDVGDNNDNRNSYITGRFHAEPPSG
jgi:hypothetical protein